MPFCRDTLSGAHPFFPPANSLWVETSPIHKRHEKIRFLIFKTRVILKVRQDYFSTLLNDFISRTKGLCLLLLLKVL